MIVSGDITGVSGNTGLHDPDRFNAVKSTALPSNTDFYSNESINPIYVIRHVAVG